MTVLVINDEQAVEEHLPGSSGLWHSNRSLRSCTLFFSYVKEILFKVRVVQKRTHTAAHTEDNCEQPAVQQKYSTYILRLFLSICVI